MQISPSTFAFTHYRWSRLFFPEATTDYRRLNEIHDEKAAAVTKRNANLPSLDMYRLNKHRTSTIPRPMSMDFAIRPQSAVAIDEVGVVITFARFCHVDHYLPMIAIKHLLTFYFFLPSLAFLIFPYQKGDDSFMRKSKKHFDITHLLPLVFLILYFTYQEDDNSLMRKSKKAVEGRRKRIQSTMTQKSRSANPEAQQQAHQVNATGKPSGK
jgi:hypothetical protein